MELRQTKIAAEGGRTADIELSRSRDLTEERLNTLLAANAERESVKKPAIAATASGSKRK